MSVITAESPRDCSKKAAVLDGISISKKKRKLLIGVLSTLVSLLTLGFLLWLTVRPSRPQFSLLTATAYDLGLPNATVDATFTARNPNAHATALYDRLWVRAAYAGQPLTGDAALPPFNQAQGDSTSLLSASLSSGGALVAPAVRYGVARDVAASGRVFLRLRINGQLRWKVGAWVSGRYGLVVDCIAVVSSSAAANGMMMMMMLQGSQCDTNL